MTRLPCALHVLTQPALLHQLVDGHICFLYGAHCHRLASASMSKTMSDGMICGIAVLVAIDTV